MVKFSEKELEAINNAKDVLKDLKAKMCRLDSLNDQINSTEESKRYYSSPVFSYASGSGSKPRPVCDMVSKLVSFNMDKIAELKVEKKKKKKEMQIILKAILYMPNPKFQLWIIKVYIGGETWRSIIKGHSRSLATNKAYLEFWNTYIKIKTEM